jgi:putative transcriptional regulator
MNVYESIMRGLNEALEYQQGKLTARSVTLSTMKPVEKFDRKDIKQIRKKTGLSQSMFAWSIGVSPKTVEAWESGRNKPEGASRRMLEVIRDDPDFVKRFQTDPAAS